MSNITFPVTQVATKDHIYRSGDVIKSSNMPAFGDCLILGFSHPTEHGDIWAKMARPHAAATCVGTTCPGVAMSVEIFEMTVEQIIKGGPPVNDGWPKVSALLSPEEVEARSS